MKICILTASLKHGGVSVVAFDVARGMAHRGHEVTFVCAGEKDKINVEMKKFYLYSYLKNTL